jgi:hypothetical protein
MARRSGPAFYNVGASVGFRPACPFADHHAGQTERPQLAVANSVKLGGDATSPRPGRRGAAKDITTDFVAFSCWKGLYGGLNLEGS